MDSFGQINWQRLIGIILIFTGIYFLLVSFQLFKPIQGFFEFFVPLGFTLYSHFTIIGGIIAIIGYYVFDKYS